MALARLVTKTYEILNSGVQPALGNKVSLRIPRQSNLRIESIMVHARVSVTGTTFAAARNGMEAMFDEVRLMVSDSAGSNRPIIKAPSAFLTHWSKDREGRHGRFTQQAIGRSAAFPATGTYDFFLPLYIVPPNLNTAIGMAFALPISDRIGEKMDILGVGDDPRLELDIASAFTGFGIATGAFTFTMLRATVYMRELAPKVPYVPTSLEYALQTAFASTAEAEILIPSSGQLLALGIEEFPTATTRGDALDTTPASLGLWKLRYGRTEIAEWYSQVEIERNGRFSQDYPNANTAAFGFDKNVTGFHVKDFLHDTNQGEAVSGASTFNLYTENRGDNLRLVATRPVTNAIIGLATHKMFAPVGVLDLA